ncbi:putative ABC transport system substrate-binding protein [Rhizobiales bacterium GAS113]|nr:putative ABC transport system substrate-binding protein [Rhizobiales bacterium GAS113]
MRRREFITLVGGGAAAWPLVARAQRQPTDRVRRIGMLARSNRTDPLTQPQLVELLKAFEHLGWTRGHNLRIDYRWNAEDADVALAFAKELVSLTPDLIVVGSTLDLAAVLKETRAIPTVFVAITDPVGQGFVESLAHPGGNCTGNTDADSTMGAKYLELLKEIAPVGRVAFIFNPTTAPFGRTILRSIEAAAPSFAVTVTAAPVHDAASIEDTIVAFAREPGAGLIVAPDAFTFVHAELIVAQVTRHRLPAVYGLTDFAAFGGLVAYSPDSVELWRQASVYVDRILRGANPADLPVEQPTKFVLVINLKTAKALGLTLSPTLLARANEVIE